MNKKAGDLSKWLLVLASTVPAAAAQPFGGVGFSENSIFGLFSSLVGIEIGSPTVFVGVVSSLAVLWGTTYIVLKVGLVKKLELGDVLLPSRSGGRNILLWLSLAVTLSMVGTNSFTQVVSNWQLFVGFSYGFGVLVALLYYIFGGGQLALGGLSKVSARGREMRAEGKEKKAESMAKMHDAEGTISKVRDAISDAEETGNEEEAEEAAQEIEQVIQLLQQVLVGDENSLEADRQELQDAMQKVQDAIGIEEEDEEELGMVAERMKRIDAFLTQAVDTIGRAGGLGRDQRANLFFGQGAFNFEDALRNATGLDNYAQGIEGKYNQGQAPGNFYGLYDVVEDLEKIDNTLRMVAESVETEETEEGQALKELVDVAEDAVETQETIRELHKELEALEGEDEMLEQVAQEYTWEQLYAEAEEEEDQEAQLENRTQKVEEALQELTSEMEEALSMLQRHLELDEEIVGELQELIAEDNELIDKFNAVIDNVEASGGGVQIGGDDIRDIAGGRLGAIESHLASLEEEEESEAQRERQVIQQLRQAIQQVRG